MEMFWKSQQLKVLENFKKYYKYFWNTFLRNKWKVGKISWRKSKFYFEIKEPQKVFGAICGWGL